jgi:hypothetical protein
LLPLAEPQGHCKQAAEHISWRMGLDPLSQTDHKIPDKPPNCWNYDPPVPKTDTQETEKILRRQFLLIKRVQACIHSS